MNALVRVRELLRAELRQLAPPGVGVWQIVGGLTLFLLFLEITTGILLMVYYRPSADEAYESVFYIINDVQLGWLIHGIHRWGAQLFILLVVVHLLRVYFHEAYRERELNWVIGVLLLLVVGAFAFTGTLLVWDQKAFWGIDAVRRVLADVPLVGKAILYFLWGGLELDANALLRFYVFHVGLLPWIAIGLVMGHLYLVSRQGLYQKSTITEQKSEQTYGDVVLRGLIFVVLSFGIVLTLAVLSPVELSGRADPLQFEQVKPAWYFLPAYGLLRLLPQGMGLALLGLGMIGLFLVPLLGRHRVIAWGIGIVTVAIIVLLGILGWQG